MPMDGLIVLDILYVKYRTYFCVHPSTKTSIQITYEKNRSKVLIEKYVIEPR